MQKEMSSKTMNDLIDEIELHRMLLQDYVNDDDNSLFIKQMDEFRGFLKDSCKLSFGYLHLYNQFKDREIFYEYKDFFMFCESFHERLIEIHEKEHIIKLSQKFSTIKEYLALDYSKKFYQDILTEFEKLDKYMRNSERFLMVRCGSFPITMFVAHEKFNQLLITGIDN